MAYFAQTFYVAALEPYADLPGKFQVSSAYGQTYVLDDLPDATDDNLEWLGDREGDQVQIAGSGGASRFSFVGSTSGGFIGSAGGQLLLLTTAPQSSGAIFELIDRPYQLPAAADTLAPMLLELTGQGTTITLTFNEDLDPGAVPSAADFIIQIPGAFGEPVATPVTDVALSGRTVVLTVGVSVNAGGGFSFQYVPGSTPLQDATGNDVTSIQRFVPTGDTQSPRLVSAVMGSAGVTLSFDEDLSMSRAPGADCFAVAMEGADGSWTQVSVTDVSFASHSGILLKLGATLAPGAQLRITYSPASDPLGDSTGNQVSAFEQTLTNDRIPTQDHNLGAALDGAVASTITITSTMLSYSDLQQGPDELTYRVLGMPSDGSLQKNGNALQFGDTFTQADIAAGRITYEVLVASAPLHGFSFVVSDSDGNVAPAASFVISYDPPDPVNTAPRFGSDGAGTQNALGGTVNFTEDGTPVILDDDVAIFDAELDGGLNRAENYSGTSLTLSRQGAACAEDVFGFAASPEFAVSGSTLAYFNVPFATFTQANGLLRISFDQVIVTKSFIDAVMRSITYSNTSQDPPASVVIEWTFSDGNAGSQGDGGAKTATGTTTVTITAVEDLNTAPTGVSLSHVSIAEESAAGTLVARLSAEDADIGQSHSYALVSGAGDTDNDLFRIVDDELQLAPGAKLDFESAPVVSVRIRVSDEGGLSHDKSFSIAVTDVNEAPTLASAVPDTSVSEDASFFFAIPRGTFVDVDLGDMLSYKATLADGGALPSWLSFNALTQTFSGMPGNDDVGTISLTVTARDGSNASASDTFTLTVANTNDAPVVSNDIDDQTVAAGSVFTFTLPAGSFTDPDGNALVYTISNAPSWLSFNAVTQTFTGLPSTGDVGAVPVTVTASDGHLTASDTFNLVVTNPSNPPGTLELTSATVAENSRNNTVVGRFVGEPGDDFTLTLTGHPARAFKIVGDELRVARNAELDFESSPTHQISVLVIDDGGVGFEEDFTVSLIDVEESPKGTGKDDVLKGDALDNVLDGRRGNDLLTGGAGADTFTFGRDYGRDTILDFDPLEGDTIDLSKAAGIRGFDDLLNNHIEVSGVDLRITAADGSVLTIKNLELGAIAEHLFVF